MIIHFIHKDYRPKYCFKHKGTLEWNTNNGIISLKLISYGENTKEARVRMKRIFEGIAMIINSEGYTYEGKVRR